MIPIIGHFSRAVSGAKKLLFPGANPNFPGTVQYHHADEPADVNSGIRLAPPTGIAGPIGGAVSGGSSRSGGVALGGTFHRGTGQGQRLAQGAGGGPAAARRAGGGPG